MHDTMNGVIGNYLLVNGVMQPELKIHARQVRLRLLNGPNATIYKISFSDKRNFHVIASDGGFLERPVAMNSIILSPAERAEVVVEFSDKKLEGHVSLLVDQDGGRRFESMRIKVDRADETAIVLPTSLRTPDRIPPFFWRLLPLPN